MAKSTKHHAVMIAALGPTLSFAEPAFATSYFGTLSAGSSDSFFQIGPTSTLSIDISAIGLRDPAICASCDSTYTDNYTVRLFDQSGKLLESVNETNYLFYNMYSSSHGIGAGPVFVSVPVGASTLEIQSQLYIAGLLGADGHPLNLGSLNIGSSGSIAAATPIPTTLPLFLTGLVGFFLFARKVGRQGTLPERGAV